VDGRDPVKVSLLTLTNESGRARRLSVFAYNEWALGPPRVGQSTLVATELAVVHNFIWHVRWTWMDRAAMPAQMLGRFVRFNLTNGAVSLAGNASIVALLTDWMNVPYIAANVAGITVCCILNFLLSELFVFAPNDVQAT
jgi:putative flippase GtrA